MLCSKLYKLIENEIEYTIREYPNGDKYWYHKDEYHRENGPALELSNGYKCWYKYGKVHREDGPARIWYGEEQYWLNNERYYNVSSNDEWIIKQIIE